MTNLSVIVPSRNAANLVPCIEAVRKHEPDVRIIVIDDGLPDRSVIDAITIDGEKPFIFARNVNIGIKTAGTDDVCILNDDALLETPDGFSRMQKAAQEHPEFGIISATTNLAGNPAQMRIKGGGIYGAAIRVGALNGLRECRKTPGNSVPVLAFVCVFIARSTIDRIGLLDERFTAYGSEDSDYCRRAHLAGIKIGIHDGCYVDHSNLKSTFRSMPTNAADLQAGRKIYLDKWRSM